MDLPGRGAVMTIPKDVREIIVDLEGDILEAGSLAAILHERLSERHAISSDDDISDGWFQVACHLVKAISGNDPPKIKS